MVTPNNRMAPPNSSAGLRQTTIPEQIRAKRKSECIRGTCTQCFQLVGATASNVLVVLVVLVRLIRTIACASQLVRPNLLSGWLARARLGKVQKRAFQNLCSTRDTDLTQCGEISHLLRRSYFKNKPPDGSFSVNVNIHFKQSQITSEQVFEILIIVAPPKIPGL